MIVFVVHYMSSALDDVAGLVMVVSLEATQEAGGYVMGMRLCGRRWAVVGGSGRKSERKIQEVIGVRLVEVIVGREIEMTIMTKISMYESFSLWRNN